MLQPQAQGLQFRRLQDGGDHRGKDAEPIQLTLKVSLARQAG